MPRHGRLMVICVAVVAGGCGGRPYTKSEFVARADAICASSLRQVRAVPQRADPAAYLAAVVPILESETAKLRALRRPPGNAADRALLERFLASLDADVRSYRQLTAAAERQDDGAVALLEAQLRGSPTASLAGAYGLASCRTPGATST